MINHLFLFSTIFSSTWIFTQPELESIVWFFGKYPFGNAQMDKDLKSI